MIYKGNERQKENNICKGIIKKYFKKAYITTHIMI